MAKNNNIRVLEQSDKNLFVYLLLVVGILGISWGAFTGVEAGVLYFSLVVGGLGLYLITLIFVNETNKNITKSYFKSPFVGSSLLAMAFYLLGWLFIILLNTFGKIFNQGFSTVQFFAPLTSGALSIGTSQTFQAGLIESSKLASWFYTVFVAGTIEEFLWAFILPITFYTIAIFLTSFIKSKTFLNVKILTWNMFFAIGMSMITFMYIHNLNGSYVGIMFLIAGLFRLAMNSFTYFFSIGLSFLIGAHQSNNNIAWINENGFSTFIEVLFGNLYGWIFVAIFMGVILYVVTRPEQIWKLLKERINS